MKTIDSFRGEYFFLSNFYESKVSYKDVIFPTAEHAFQAMKVNNSRVWKVFATLDSPSDAKILGRVVTLRKNWEQLKDQVMYEVVYAKFQKKSLAKKLLSTGNDKLIEGNTWRDVEWGVCNGKGENKLGKILMSVRKQLIEGHRYA